MAAITFVDETTSGSKVEAFTLQSLEAKVTLRELIRMRVYQEVQDFNRTQPDVFRGLVQPSETERTLNGYKMKKKRQINWQEQFDKALASFEASGFLVLVDERQIDELDETVNLGVDTRVSFIKLVPLVGG